MEENQNTTNIFSTERLIICEIVFCCQPPGLLTSLQKCQMQTIASVTESLSIEINVTKEHLKRWTFEINPGQRDIVWKNGTNGNPRLREFAVAGYG
jgi:hypothetical protein